MLSASSTGGMWRRRGSSSSMNRIGAEPRGGTGPPVSMRMCWAENTHSSDRQACASFGRMWIWMAGLRPPRRSSGLQPDCAAARAMRSPVQALRRGRTVCSTPPRAFSFMEASELACCIMTRTSNALRSPVILSPPALAAEHDVGHGGHRLLFRRVAVARMGDRLREPVRAAHGRPGSGAARVITLNLCYGYPPPVGGFSGDRRRVFDAHRS